MSYWYHLHRVITRESMSFTSQKKIIKLFSNSKCVIKLIKGISLKLIQKQEVVNQRPYSSLFLTLPVLNYGSNTKSLPSGQSSFSMSTRFLYLSRFDFKTAGHKSCVSWILRASSPGSIVLTTIIDNIIDVMSILVHCSTCLLLVAMVTRNTFGSKETCRWIFPLRWLWTVSPMPFVLHDAHEVSSLWSLD